MKNNKNKVHLNRILAFIGTIFLFIPILFPILLSILHLLATGRFLFDYLIPAELFFLVIAGTLILLIASIRSEIYRKSVIALTIIIITTLPLAQMIAVLTGLANGDMEPVGWRLYLVLMFLGIYTISILIQGIYGIRLIKALFKKEEIN